MNCAGSMLAPAPRRLEAGKGIEGIEQVAGLHVGPGVEADGLLQPQFPGDEIAEFGLAAARLAGDQQRLPQGESGVDGVDQRLVGDIVPRAGQVRRPGRRHMAPAILARLVGAAIDTPVDHCVLVARERKE
ncbi:MAG: hypothetical protein HQL39_04170 [Alphaproteobacteria bacterium]|nr:hypothetical protein [Alphaproteobacteria bacterium]